MAIYSAPVLRGEGQVSDGLTVAMLAAFSLAYALARGPLFQWGILVLVVAPLLVLISAFLMGSDGAGLLVFSLIPILLGGLLLDFGAAAALAGLNLLGAGLLVATGTGDASDLLSAFLFLLASSPVVLLGAGFLERSIQDAEQANDRLQAADEYRRRLLNNIVHDLATPLTPLNLQVSVMERDPDQGRRAAIMRRNLDLLRRLISDVADLAKIDAGQLTLHRRPLDLSSLAHEAAEALRKKAEERHVLLEVAVSRAEVVADADRMTQVLYNLITNAIKFTPAGGIVSVRCAPRAHDVDVCVQDSGRGLDPHEIPRLFKPFSQVHERSETSERGSGLGLFISKAIVEAHGGNLTVESQGRGQGSTFCFGVPTQHEEQMVQ